MKRKVMFLAILSILVLAACGGAGKNGTFLLRRPVQ